MFVGDRSDSDSIVPKCNSGGKQLPLHNSPDQLFIVVVFIMGNNSIDSQSKPTKQSDREECQLDHKLIIGHGWTVDPPQERCKQYNNPAHEFHRRRDVTKMKRLFCFKLEFLLLVSILLLIVQLVWPSIVHWWNYPSPGAIGLDQFESKSLAADFLIYIPENYRRQNWPLVVYLHGSGAVGNDPNMLRSQELLHLKLPAIVAVPQCLPSHAWDPQSVAGFVKYVASRYRVDSRRIYLIGHSMGAYGLWRTAATNPNLYAALVPISGHGNPSDAKVFAGLPVWAFHGDKDNVIPAVESRRMMEAIREAGGKPRLTILPDAGHGTCPTVYKRRDLWEWLFRQRRTE